MTGWAARRFWRNVEVVPSGGGWEIALDGRGLKTPLKSPLALPGRAMAEAVAEEWRAQGDVIDPLSMPVTRSANFALGMDAKGRSAAADHLAAYAECDLLCYRAEAPAALAERQASAWDPMLCWAASEFGARLKVTTGISHVDQPTAAVKALSERVHGMDAFPLAAFHDLVTLTGSLILGFAAIGGVRPLEELWAMSRVDEEWQAGLWGRDPEADALAEAGRGAFLHAGRFHRLSRER